jgi:hypothetical protein
MPAPAVALRRPLDAPREARQHEREELRAARLGAAAALEQRERVGRDERAERARRPGWSGASLAAHGSTASTSVDGAHGSRTWSLCTRHPPCAAFWNFSFIRTPFCVFFCFVFGFVWFV